MSVKTHHEKYYNYLFILFVIGFIVLKFNDLFIPYFWDELGVYSQCAVHQYYHKLSLMPASVPPVLSRGHPLLLTALNAGAMKFFGTGVYVAHGLHLLISVLLLLAMYLYTSRYFNRLTGLIAVILLMVQPIFIAQSILVLPEVLLSLLILLSLVNYYEKRYLLFGLFASLAILTKESAVVLPVAVFSYSVLRWLLVRTNNEAFKPVNLLSTFIPYLVFGIFLLAQKAQNGWYFFPYHINNTGFTFEEVWMKLSDFAHFVLHRQGRYWFKSILIVGAILALLRNQINRQSAAGSIISLFIIFTLGFLAFSSLSFYMERYIMAVLVLVSITVSLAIVSVFRNKYLVAGVTVCLAIAGLSRIESPAFYNDIDMNYRRQVNTLQQAVNFCADQSEGNELVYGNFPAFFALNFKESGYLQKGKKLNATETLTDSVRYFVTSAPGNDFNAYKSFTDTLIAEFNDGYSKSKVYYVTSRKP